MSLPHDQLLAAGRRRLAQAGLDTAALDARLLLEAASGLDRLGLVMAGPQAASEVTIAAYERLLALRLEHRPVGRILGHRDFHGLRLSLGPDTLEPRPETEMLVQAALDWVAAGALPGVAPDGEGLLLADIGTGTGAIALALLAELPGAQAVATDIAPGALAVAGDNARRLGLDARITFRLGSYLEPLAERFQLILSNPPYVVSGILDELQPEVRRFDPERALDGGADGLVAYRALASGLEDRLCAGGRVALEIGHDQGASVGDLCRAAGLGDVRVLRDLAGLDRMVTGQRV